jgi:hypothetical protein
MGTTVILTVIGRVYIPECSWNLTCNALIAAMDLVDIDFEGMFPDLEHHSIRYVLHMCGVRDIPAQTRLIEYEGIEMVEDLANYSDAEIEAMADRNSKRTPANTRIQFGMARTKALKAITHWVRKKSREGTTCDLRELTPELITELISEINAIVGKEKSDSKLYYPDAFVANDYKNWIKKVTNYLDSRIGKAGVPLTYVIRAPDVNADEAPDEYTRSLWAASFQTRQFREDNREVYHLFKDLLTKTEGATWFEKVKDGDGRAAHLLLREHYVGEAHDQRRAASALAKLENLFWKSESSFPFEKYLTRLNEAFMEMEEAEQPLYPAQKVQWLIRGVKNDDIQVQTTIGIIRDRYLTNFDEACLTLSRTISSRFASIEPGKNKRSIGAVNSNSGRAANRGRGRGRHGGRGGSNTGGRMKVVMNGVDVTDVTRNFTSDDWDKLRAVGGHTYVYQRRDYLSGNAGRGGRDNRGGRGGRGGRSLAGRYASDRPAIAGEDRNVAAANVTDIVEYDASTSSTIASQSTSSNDRGGRSGGRFGPRRND